MTVEVTRPVLRYFGGKFRIAEWIISHFPQHRVYVEPFGGGASVLLRKPRSYFEVYNDLDEEVVNVFRVVRDRADELRRLLELTPWARKEYELAHEPAEDPLERARRTIVRSFMGFAGDAINIGRKTGFRSQSRCAANKPPCRDWVNYFPCLPIFATRMQEVVIECRPAMDVIRRYDAPTTLFYLDPPYVHAERSSGRNYTFEMTDEDHHALCAAVQDLKGMVILSGYPNEIYDGLLGWERREFTGKASVFGNAERTEVLWLNPAAARGQAQLRFDV